MLQNKDELLTKSDVAQTFHDLACTVCGCVCDDLRITVSDGAISSVENQCSLAEPWFEGLQNSEQNPPPIAVVDGRPATIDAAVLRATQILRNSRAPLVWGLSRSSTEGQQTALQLAETLGAIVDTTASVCHGPSIMAIQVAGESTSTLGEIKNRADLVIFWGADPVVSHPRHFERYSIDATGIQIPSGRSDRTVVVIDTHETETAKQADLFIQVKKHGDFEAIWTLRQLIQDQQPTDETNLGALLPELQQLAALMTGCRYGVVFFGLGLARTGLGHLNIEGLLKLVAELNAHTRFTTRRMRIPGDVTGADSVLCWQTGYPFAVSLAREYPRYNPGEFTATELLEREEVDACILVGSEAVEELTPKAKAFLDRIPVITLEYPHQTPMVNATVQFTTAVYGIHQPGTVYRMDEIPIPLRQILPSNLPTDGDILQRMNHQLQEL